MTNATHQVALNQDTTIAKYLRILAVEVQDAAGNWSRLEQIYITDPKVSITDYEETAGLPRQYAWYGNYIYLFPAPATASVTLTDGLKVHFEPEPDLFGYGDTSPEPGFAEPFHTIVSYGASLDWLLVNGPKETYDRLLVKYEQKRKELREFNASQNQDAFVGFNPVIKTSEFR